MAGKIDPIEYEREWDAVVLAGNTGITVPSPRERMEARGWYHVIDDECRMAWWRNTPGTATVAHYSDVDRELFERELSECIAEATRAGWEH